MTSPTPFAGVPTPRDATPAHPSSLARVTAACVPVESALDRDAFSCGHLQRGRLMAAIINCLRQARGGVVSEAELIEWIWGADENGGPEYADSDIRQTIMRLRDKGFPIEARKTRGYSYVASRLEYCDEGEALQQ